MLLPVKMLRSFLLLLCIAGALGLTGQDTNTQSKKFLKAQYGLRGHHSLNGLFHGAGLQVGIQLDETWSLQLQHNRYMHDKYNGRMRTAGVGVRYHVNEPTEAVRLFIESNFSILSSKQSSRSSFKTGWELNGGFGLRKPLAQWLFLEAQAIHSFGLIYGERVSLGDIAPDSPNSRVKEFSLQLGLGVQF